MNMLESPMPGVWRWTAKIQGLPDMVGHAVATGDGVVIFDPPLAPGLVAALGEIGTVRAIILTGAHHDRASGALRARLGTPELLVPQMDADRLMAEGLMWDRTFGEGDTLPGGFRAMALSGVPPFEPEWAFFEGERGLLVISDIVVFGKRDILYGDGFGPPMPSGSLVPHLERILATHPESIIAGHGGVDIAKDGAARLTSLIARHS